MPDSKTKTKTKSWSCLFFSIMMMIMTVVVAVVCFPLCLVICSDSFQQNRRTVWGRVYCSPFEYGWQNIVGRLAATSLFFTPSSNAANQASYYHDKEQSVIKSYTPQICSRGSYCTRREQTDKFIAMYRHTSRKNFSFPDTMHALYRFPDITHATWDRNVILTLLVWCSVCFTSQRIGIDDYVWSIRNG